MLKPLLFAVPAIPAALLAPLLVISPQNATAGAAGNPGPACEVRVIPAGSGVTLEAVVQSNKTLSGDYEFVMTKRGAGGSSTSAQSGSFAVEAGQEEVVAEVTLGSDRNARYSADLLLHWSGGETSCTATD